MNSLLRTIISAAIEKRKPLITAPYQTAFRLLNGFSEGLPNYVIDIFGRTLVIDDYSGQDREDIIHIIKEKLPWLQTGILKERKARTQEERNGVIVFGSNSDRRIHESGVWYSLNLTLNRDSSFYIDTRGLREWVYANLAGKTVLNTFAYTGSIGVAALVGGAEEVVHLDLNGRFLDIAKRSTDMNQKKVNKHDFQIGDFWSRINQYKKSGKTFDCVILDPPVFSKTQKGTIDLAKNYTKLINKVRPVIKNNGYLITINNALFRSGKDHQKELNELCKDGYLSIETRIPVPFDCIGDDATLTECLPADPAPYNHSTKITVLRVKKKDAV
jgi:23S rRNA (cytosine1962-C5)-methyltransferase